MIGKTGFWRVIFTGRQGGFIAAMIAFWVVCGLSWSGFFLRPIALTITGAGMVLVRQTPLGTVDAEWMMDVTNSDGTECSARTVSIYQSKPGDTARFATPHQLLPCLGKLSVIEASWTVRIFGVPLRPVRITTIMETGQ